jgi:hypothetical protein
MSETIAPPASSPDLLADLLAAFGTKPKAAPKPKKVKSDTPTPVVRPHPRALNLERTGYSVWEPVARAIHFQWQECECCGGNQKVVCGEFYEFSNGKAKAMWQRHEGYELPAEPLPFKFYLDEPRLIPVCADCAQTYDSIDSLFQPVQTCLPF